MSNTKLYICVREEVDSHMVPVLVAHAILNADEHFMLDQNYWDWKLDSFKKVVVKVNQKEWDKIVQIPKVYLGYENSQMNGEKSCAVIPVMVEYPNVIKYAHMWKP